MITKSFIHNSVDEIIVVTLADEDVYSFIITSAFREVLLPIYVTEDSSLKGLRANDHTCVVPGSYAVSSGIGAPTLRSLATNSLFFALPM